MFCQWHLKGIKWCENGCSGSITLKRATVSYPSTKQSKYSNCTVTSTKYLEENQEIHFSMFSCTCTKPPSGDTSACSVNDTLSHCWRGTGATSCKQIQSHIIPLKIIGIHYQGPHNSTSNIIFILKQLHSLHCKNTCVVFTRTHCDTHRNTRSHMRVIYCCMMVIHCLHVTLYLTK